MGLCGRWRWSHQFVRAGRRELVGRASKPYCVVGPEGIQGKGTVRRCTAEGDFVQQVRWQNTEDTRAMEWTGLHTSSFVVLMFLLFIATQDDPGIHTWDVHNLTFTCKNGLRSWRRPPHLPLHHDTALQHWRQAACGDSDVMLKPMISPLGFRIGGVIKGYIIWAISTSAESPIGNGRFRPMCGGECYRGGA